MSVTCSCMTKCDIRALSAYTSIQPLWLLSVTSARPAILSQFFPGGHVPPRPPVIVGLKASVINNSRSIRTRMYVTIE